MKREAIETARAQYTCTFRAEPEGGYTIRCSAFPEIVSFGATLKEARQKAREAIELCIGVYQGRGWPVPPSERDDRKTVTEMVPVKLRA